MERSFAKKNKNDKIWWCDDHEAFGKLEFSFDKKKIFNAWTDYPSKLNKEQKQLFDKENPFWADFLTHM